MKKLCMSCYTEFEFPTNSYFCKRCAWDALRFDTKELNERFDFKEYVLQAQRSAERNR